MFENIGGTELLVVLLVLFIFFGPKRLPEMGKNLGKAVGEFKKALRGIQDDFKNSTKM